MKENSNKYDVIVLGAGASGLFCAMTAAQRGRRVIVLEKSNKVGKKILMSGGGRCNFTNHYVDANNFISNNSHFCKSALNRYTQWDFISLVEKYDIQYEERKHSQLFCKDSAKDILNMLLDECEQAGVHIRTHCEINAVKEVIADSKSEGQQQCDRDSRYCVKAAIDGKPIRLECHSLVIATGALSIPTLGGSSYGYDIAKQFLLDVIEPQAGLVPFMFSDSMKAVCESLSGLSVEVEVDCNGQSFTENMLFTHRGISGPVMLQISNYWSQGDSLNINLLPNINISEWIIAAKNNNGKQLLKTVLNHELPKALVSELQKIFWREHENTPLAEMSDSLLSTIGGQLSHWNLKPSTTEGYRTAEVTLRGVTTDKISSKTMETKSQPGLYFIGEVVDVTGHLGGFNFQWAWSSGYCAGSYA